MRFALEPHLSHFEKVEQDQYISSYDIAEELGVDDKIVLRHLRKHKKKLDIWVQHDLTERNLMHYIFKIRN